MSKSILVDIKDSYGILQFKHNFIYNENCNFYSLYSQNGTMKSSFAKTLDDHSKGMTISDKLFKIQGSCEVLGVDNINILSFPSFDGQVEMSGEATSLVTNEAARKVYDEALKDVKAAYETFSKKLSEAASISQSEDSNDLIEKMYRTFVDSSSLEIVTVPSVVQLLKGSLTEIRSGNESFTEISYNRFIQANFKNFIKNPKYTGVFSELAKAYDEFRGSATYYRKGFDASSAQKLISELGKSKYFEAEHEVALKNSDGKVGTPITNKDELEASLKTDFDLIIEKNPSLKVSLEQLIKDFGTGTNSDVRSIFEDATKRDILLFMGSEVRFYKNMWYGYLHTCLVEIDKLLEEHDIAKDNITAALNQAKDCENEWEEIRDVFNDRFSSLPYRIAITNKKDAIVSNLVHPVFEVKYENPRNTGDPYRERPDEHNRLYEISKVLSNGERKALHLLNVIFRLRTKLKGEDDVLAVFDDLVESFDYKNKYAFFEYLQELATDHKQLYVILLTHNFDFYRLVYDKLHPKSEDQFKMIMRAKNSTLEVSDMFDPRVFSTTKKASKTDKAAWISLIPFARNIIEYQADQDEEAYKRLTQCLHVMKIKPTYVDIVEDVKRGTSVDVCPLNAINDIHQEIINTACSIANDSNDDFDLHKNITLAIGIRLEIERYIISKISDDVYNEVLAKERDQTRQLLGRYKNNTSDTDKDSKLMIFNKAAMMVDGSIHLNSFMYEPLIDMGTWELKDMYREIKLFTRQSNKW